MRLTVFVEPQQGASYEDQLRIAQRAEECGFEAFFRSDHYLRMGQRDGLPGPTDAWLTLAGLARETTRIRLGTLLSAATFRYPGPLAISAAQVDQMSGGRVELGLGAGWYEQEHTAYAIPFPPVRERFERLAEQLEIVVGLWSTSTTFSFEGNHYRVTDSPGLPKPVQSPYPPLIIGGHGTRRTPALAARFATEFNVPFGTVEVAAERIAGVRAACEQQGRDPGSLVYSVALPVCCGVSDAEVARRAAAIGTDVDSLRNRASLVGTPAQVAEQIRAYQALGMSRVHLQVLDMSDLDHLNLVSEQVSPLL